MIIRDILLIILSCLLGIIMALIHADKYDKENKIFAVNELEKVKAEIEEKEFKLNCITMSDVALKTAYIEVTKLLNKHIAELKEGD